MYKILLYVFILASSALISACSLSSTQAVGSAPDYTKIDDLPLVQAMSNIELQSGDAYTLEMFPVQAQFANRWHPMRTYAGSIPGPVFHVVQGSSIQLTVHNKIRGIQTTLHSHGLRGNVLFDGVPKDMMGSQDPIAYDSEFTYTLTFPDAGVFWYHPHMREDMQQDLGLYGVFVVKPQDSNQRPETDQEQVLVLDDILLDQDNKIAPYDHSMVTRTMMGRFGNHLLVNGQDTISLQTNTSNVLRLYILNAASVRTFALTIPGAQMTLLGSDIGLYQSIQTTDNILVAPAERYIVDISFERPGTYDITNIPDGKKLGTIQVTQSTKIPKVSYHQTIKDIPSDIEKYYTSDPDKELTIAMSMGHMNHAGMMMEHNPGVSLGNILYQGLLAFTPSSIERQDTMPMMNDMSNTENIQRSFMDIADNRQNMAINWKFTQGSLVKVRVYNPRSSMHPMQHPFHIHGQRFLVLNKNGQQNNNLARKDTVLIPAGEYVDILVDMSNPGTWLAHCHIPEHMSAGMMMHFTVK